MLRFPANGIHKEDEVSKRTKQGVRNLDLFPGKSSGRVLEPVPMQADVCKHKNTSPSTWMNLYWDKCLDCGEYIGEPW